MGAFPGEVPAWVPKTGGGSRGTGGLIPTQFGDSSSSAVQAQEARRDIQRERETLEQSRLAAQQAQENSSAGAALIALSPIDRIIASCPVRENLIRDALLETDRAERLGKYRALTGVCPQSYDLWLWLGTDHFHANELTDAAYALERSVALSPDDAPEHSQALGLLNTVRAQMLGGPAAVEAPSQEPEQAELPTVE